MDRGATFVRQVYLGSRVGSERNILVGFLRHLRRYCRDIVIQLHLYVIVMGAELYIGGGLFNCNGYLYFLES